MLSNPNAGAMPASQALNVGIASTGRLGADGKLVLTGGGDLLLRVGGAINPIERTFAVGSVSQERCADQPARQHSG